MESSQIVKESKRVPNDAQFGLIKSLYEHKHVLISGWIAHSLALYLCFISTNNDYNYLVIDAIITVIIVLRYWDMRLFASRFDGRSTSDIDVIRSWETRYMIGSGAVSLMIGINAGYSLFLQPYSTASLLALSMSFGSLISIVGRNFGSQRNVRLLAILNGLPTCAGMVGYGVMHGDWPCAAGGLLLLPVLFISDGLASFVRDILLKSIVAEKKAAGLAVAFDAAVSNMPTGMIMIEHDGTVIMLNDIAAQCLGLGDSPRFIQKNVDALLEEVIRVGEYSEDMIAEFKAMMTDMIAGRETEVQFKTPEMKTIEFASHRVTPSSDRRANRTTKFAGTVILCEDVTKRLEITNRNWRQARFDYLSKLPNRQYMVELLANARDGLRDDRVIAFCQFDVDGFKLINDTMGHEAGDEVIAKVAEKMMEIQAGDDRLILARLGGDEFVLAFKDLLPYDDMHALFNHAFSQICSAYQIKNKTINLRCSGGVAYANREQFNLDDLMRKSDYVLYKVKHDPKRPVDAIWGMFSDNVEAEYLQKKDMREALKEAIHDGSIGVAFQPVYRQDGTTIEFCEALVRWTHSDLGEVNPTEMIKSAEELGLIQNITRQVLNKACEECAAWEPMVGVSVNFSALDLHQTDCIDMISDALKMSGLEPHRLQIEVNEAAIMKNINRVKAVLNQIAALGVKITVDDFGNGYSLLNYMHTLPITKVKIARSFIQSLNEDEKLSMPLNALIQLSNGNQFAIVAEGVETDAQLNALRKVQRVDLIQGYLLGHPISGDKIRERLTIDAASRQGSLVHLNSYKPKGDGNRGSPTGKG